MAALLQGHPSPQAMNASVLGRGTGEAILLRRQFRHSLQDHHTRRCRSVVVAISAHDNRTTRRAKHGSVMEQRTEAMLVSDTSQNSTVASPPPFPPPQPQLGSPLFWIGVGVGLSVFFTWAAGRIKNYALQQAFKTMMQQSGQGSNQFGGMGATPPGPFPFPPMPMASSLSSVLQSPPSSPSQSPSPSIVSTASLQSTVYTDIKEVVEKPNGIKKSAAFTDVDIELLSDEKSTPTGIVSEELLKQVSSGPFSTASTKEYCDTNGNNASNSTKSSSGTVNDGKSQSFMSVEMLEKMLDDPQIQKMVFSYLPEELRDPATFKSMIQLPPVRQQLQEALNNMGGQDGAEMLNYMNNDAVKQQFEQLGLTPEEAVAKILANPEIAASLQNSRVVDAIMDCSQNPLNITKYQNDKEVMDALYKIAELFPGKTMNSF